MTSNAAQAWSERNSLGVTWNDWTNPTNDPNPDAFEMTGMVGLFEEPAGHAASPFNGNYEIKSSASGLSLGVQGDSSANSAPIVQNHRHRRHERLLDVRAARATATTKSGTPCTGQLLNVSNQSGAPGGLVVQWPAGGLVPGNDQWLPVQNSGGTWSFYNRDSQLALDDPAGSTAAARSTSSGHRTTPPTRSSP